MAEPDAPIREVMLDVPLFDSPDRPPGMVCMRRVDVPEERREEADAWVAERGGLIGQAPTFTVIGGTTPANAPVGETFYALPPAAFAEE